MIDAVMYGMMPRAKIVRRRKLAAAEQVDESQEGATVLVEELRQHVGVDAGRGDVSPEPVHGEQPERKQNALPQVGNAKYVGQLLKHYKPQLPVASGQLPVAS